MEGVDLNADLDEFWSAHAADLIGFRRDLHAHPETGNTEHRTTRNVALRLAAAGLRPAILPKGTGLIVDIGPDIPERGVVALRADIDALPMEDEKRVPYRSTVPGVCHACGHDVHTTVLLGTGLFLAAQAEKGMLPGRIRLVFQPAEELGSGALDVISAGGMDGVSRIFALHCDPRLDAGKLGVRTGAITAACDKIKVRVTGPGGHTARPHLTADLVFALAKIVTELPAALSRRVDPRSSLSLVWGRVSAGKAPNAIPDEGVAEGTIRTLDEEAWRRAPEILRGLIESVANAYGIRAELEYTRNVPPTVNDKVSADMLTVAGTGVLGLDGVVNTPQSLGGEDFAWYLEKVPGALARLGTRVPGLETSFDLHQPSFDVDERAIAVGIRVMSGTSLTALWDDPRAMESQQIPAPPPLPSAQPVRSPQALRAAAPVPQPLRPSPPAPLPAYLPNDGYLAQDNYPPSSATPPTTNASSATNPPSATSLSPSTYRLPGASASSGTGLSPGTYGSSGTYGLPDAYIPPDAYASTDALSPSEQSRPYGDVGYDLDSFYSNAPRR
jgi:amidohydrolase